MPTYAYRCPKCGTEFEKFQKMTEPPRARCPRCRAAAKRVITGGGGVLFKGEGFYATDYRSASYKKAAESDRASGERADASEAKSETKEPKAVESSEARTSKTRRLAEPSTAPEKNARRGGKGSGETNT